jgi:hypothetical protein
MRPAYPADEIYRRAELRELRLSGTVPMRPANAQIAVFCGLWTRILSVRVSLAGCRVCQSGLLAAGSFSVAAAAVRLSRAVVVPCFRRGGGQWCGI